MGLFSVKNLEVRKGRTRLLENITFDLEAGELKGIFGPSGAGKSTLLHTIAGLQDSSFTVSGQIYFGADDISCMLPEERSHLGVAIVLQQLCLFPDRSVIDNVAYPLRWRGFSAAEASDRAQATLRVFHIQELANRKPDRISGGQQQRVALARAVSYSPRLLLLDEPFKGLEQELRDQLLALIRNQVIQSTAVLLVTHERRDLELAADSVIEIRNGKIQCIEKRQSNGDGVFGSTREKILLPDFAEPSGFVPAELLRINRNGFETARQGADERTVRVKVMERRAVSFGRTALLVEFEKGQLGWVQLPSERAVNVQVGELITLNYRTQLKGVAV